jgi:hypothetical protein
VRCIDTPKYNWAAPRGRGGIALPVAGRADASRLWATRRSTSSGLAPARGYARLTVSATLGGRRQAGWRSRTECTLRSEGTSSVAADVDKPVV